MKAIDTIYKGYKFRSRLEARWAVFYDALGIKWEYEKEGFELTKGIYRSKKYLPDFWLPEYGIWVEIKGEKPTPEECSKASLLNMHSKKRSYIFAGNIGIPDQVSEGAYLYFFESASLRHPEWEAIRDHNMDSLFGTQTEENIKKYTGIKDSIDITDLVDYDVLDIISGMEKLGVSARVGKDGNVELVSFRDREWAPLNRDLYIDIVGGHLKRSSLMELLLKYPGWNTRALQDISSGQMWVECTTCNEILITPMQCVYSCPRDNYQYGSPRLIAAYTAARQARFEHGEKG